MRGGIKDRGRMNVDMKPPGPGLAPRPPPPVAADLETNLHPNAEGSLIHACPSCTPLCEALHQVHEQLLSAQTRINGAIILGKEAVERSTARVGAYEILERIHMRHGIPFQDGDSLPEEYTKHFPLHKYHDGIQRGAEGRAAMVDHTADAEAAIPSQSLEGSHGHRGHRTGNSSSSNNSTEESDESIPPGFTPRSSEQSDDEGYENPWVEEPEDNRDWERDPQALSGSELGSGSGEHQEDPTGLRNGEEDNESDYECDEDGVGEGEDDEDGSGEDGDEQSSE